MELYVIYDHPVDFPNGFPCRKFWDTLPGDLVGHGATLAAAREFIPPGYVNIGRCPGDDPKLVEVWV